MSAAAAHEAAKITTAEVAVTKAERTISEAQVVEQEVGARWAAARGGWG